MLVASEGSAFVFNRRCFAALSMASNVLALREFFSNLLDPPTYWRFSNMSCCACGGGRIKEHQFIERSFGCRRLAVASLKACFGHRIAKTKDQGSMLIALPRSLRAVGTGSSRRGSTEWRET